MKDMNFIASVNERDIDLLILEELTVSDEFCDWFSARVFGCTVYNAAGGAWHSVVAGDNRESDLLFIFLSQSGERIAILIENKIDAPPQPQQAQGYRNRGEQGEVDGFWDSFKTCLIAPERYLASSRQTELYDHEVSYEEILAYFSSRRFRDNRFGYKAKVIQEAIEQNRRGYQPVFSREMTAFVEKYVMYAQRHFPQLGVQAAKPRPAGSTWIKFRPAGLATSIDLCHQMTAGYAKVFFTGAIEQLEAITNKYAPYLTEYQLISAAGKSVSITVEVPKLEPLQPFEQQQEKVAMALQQLSALLQVLVKAT
jgi:hypothetical protein